MTQQVIDIGSAPDDGTGDPLRTSFDKTNDNFTELYAKGATEGLWNFNQTSTDTSTTPVSGRFKTNSGNYRTATQIAIHAITIQGIDRSSTLRTLLVGDLIQCQDKSNAAAWCRYSLQSLPVDHGTWFQLNVTFQADGGVASGDNQEIVFVFTASSGSAAGGSSTVIAPQGRLTLQTATPVMTTTQAAKTTIFYTPYVGNQIVLYNGTSMVPTTFTELSVLTTDTTKSPAAIGASKVNDWFVWSDAGTLRIGHGPDWTSDTVRSAGTALVMVAGALINAVAITNGPAIQRGTYVGTTRSNASSQLDWIYGSTGVAAQFNVWNTYNRIDVSSVSNIGGSYAGSVIPLREMGNVSSMETRFVRGLDEEPIFARATSGIIGSSGLAGGMLNLGLDSLTTVPFSTSGYTEVSSMATPIASWDGLPGLGYHFVAGLESTQGPNTVTFGSQVPSTLWTRLRA